MPKVVTNTTPLIALLKLNKLELLRHLYSHIYIPSAVYHEVEAGKSKEFYPDLSKIDWIRISKVSDQQATNYFLDLDSGEAEAIVLATEINADLIVLDEKIGRFHAKHANLNVTETLGILVQGKKRGYIKSLKPLINQLTEKGMWISDNVKEEILKKVNER